MATHNQLGKHGEQLAAAYLEEKAYTILFRNWRYSYYEIDIIASQNNKLHFIEVKTRSSSRFGHPEESVTKKKFRYLQQAADEFLHQHPGHYRIQYDILSITFRPHQPPEYFLIEDVFL
ncbi:YraN family protein [Niabella beijingensis]|uniref:YraN family protein n=1 Tax=Niabella beijingensis TaxID=2872700 RepID=UPI001CBDCFDF|nr:YraN family protein [Niabella beijingensis]MBZ4190468.1 YraN family protein [Niabella beijingensis]